MLLEIISLCTLYGTLMRTVIYARYSSQLQNSRSIEDQIAACRARAEREGWQIVEVFTDYAISGAAGITEAARPGLNACLTRIEAGGIDQLLAEATDRIARHQGDAFTILERVQFAGTRLFTLSDGEVSEITATFKGLMDAQFRKELGAKIKRGQAGTVRQKRSPAGLCFGYRTANRIDEAGRPIRGLREIDEDEAEIVRRIFREYAAGASPVTIARRLNEDGVPGPRGHDWRATTIRPDHKRGNGMLVNRLYVGELVHNRTSKVVEPRSRTVRIRPNPPAEWVIETVSHLRIIPQDLWEKVQAILEQHRVVRPETARRPKHLLSGLGVCGSCGGSFILISADRWGCNSRRVGAICSNNRQITTAIYEQRVLSGLKERLLDPELVKVYVEEYQRERARRTADARRQAGRLERKQADASAKIDRLVAAIAAGAGEFIEVREALAAAKVDLAAAQEQLAEIEAVPVVILHPSIAEDYRKQISELHEALLHPDARLTAVPAVRSLIDRVVLSENPLGRGVNVMVEGRLNAIVALATGSTPVEPTITMERVKGLEPSS
jgi:DNA invertase Pin-like site-specific DNA recombinase